MISSNKKVWWICRKCGHEWEAAIHSRSRGTDCPKCHKAGRPAKIPTENESG